MTFPPVNTTALPTLTRASAPLTCEVEVVNEHGERQRMSIPAERALTVYVDKPDNPLLDNPIKAGLAAAVWGVGLAYFRNWWASRR